MMVSPAGKSMLEIVQSIHKKGCRICGLRPEFCVCKRLPSIATRTRISIVIHRTEIIRPSNSGQLAAACLKYSDLVLYGNPDHFIDWSSIARQGYQPAILFPEGILTLTADMAAGAPLQLIIPDGNWRQAGRMFRRLIVKQKLTGLRLPVSGPSAYQLRRRPEHQESQSTFEAIIRALEILEGAHVAEPLQEVFGRFISRHLVSRGKIHPRDML